MIRPITRSYFARSLFAWLVLLALPCLGAEVSIEVTGISSSGSVDRVTMTRLLAWKKGRLCKATQYGFAVGAVLSGHLSDPDYPSRPVGTNHLDVILMNDALLAMEKLGGGSVRGKWTLSELPDGSYLVSDPAKTPLGALKTIPTQSKIARIEKELRSGVPKRQYEALTSFEETGCFSLAPAVINLLDSPASVSRTMHAPGGRGQFQANSPLRQAAHSTLLSVMHPLMDRQGPGRDDSIAVWEKWWKGLLAVEPFPKLKLVPGEPKTLTTLAMNQSHPRMSMDPSGSSLAMSVTRLQHPHNGVRNGIRLLEVQNPLKDDFIYKVPPKARAIEPTDLAVGWSGGQVGLVWQENRYGAKPVVQFMALDTATRRSSSMKVKIKKVDHMRLAPVSPGIWLLAVVTTAANDEMGNRDLRLLLLDAKRRSSKKIRKFDLSFLGKNPDLTDLSISAAVATPLGPALAINNPYTGSHLVLLNKKLTIRGTVRIDDPKTDGHGFDTRLAVNGKRIIAAWRESDNWGDRLFTRTFDLTGQSATKPALISAEPGVLADPVAAGEGFALAWVDHSQTRNQVRTTWLSSDGKPKPVQMVHRSLDWISALGLGYKGGKARVLARDTQYYPHRVWIKEAGILPK